MNNISKTVLVIILLFSGSFAIGAKTDFECKLYLYKNTCWNGYDVEVKIFDPYEKPRKDKAKIKIKKDKQEGHVKFSCKSREYVTLEANFSPTIWEGKENETYRSKKTWVIPTEIEDDALDWRINICFPSDFQGVPQPTGALRDCKCTREVISTIQLDKDGNPIAGTENQKLKKDKKSKKKSTKR